MSKPSVNRPYTQTLAAESFVDLSACRALFSRAAALIDEHHERNPASRGTAEELTQLFAEAQSAKVFIGEAAVRIVDRALALSGGAGYLNGSPPARPRAGSRVSTDAQKARGNHDWR